MIFSIAAELDAKFSRKNFNWGRASAIGVFCLMWGFFSFALVSIGHYFRSSRNSLPLSLNGTREIIWQANAAQIMGQEKSNQSEHIWQFQVTLLLWSEISVSDFIVARWTRGVLKSIFWPKTVKLFPLRFMNDCSSVRF
jgi:hypothetical protein